MGALLLVFGVKSDRMLFRALTPVSFRINKNLSQTPGRVYTTFVLIKHEPQHGVVLHASMAITQCSAH
jgi:hypothetical protein